MKRASLLLIAIAIATTIFSNNAVAATPDTNDITDHFSFILKRNAIIVNYVVEEDKRLGTYPKGTGTFIAEKQESNFGEWYYGNKLNSPNGFIYNGEKVTKLDLANIHYGYIGRVAGFSKSQLMTPEGSNQISPLPENWSSNYFHLSGLKGRVWINYGANMFDNKNLPYSTPAFAINYADESQQTNFTLSVEEKLQFKKEMLKISQKINSFK